MSTALPLFKLEKATGQAKARHGDMHAEPGGPNCQFVRCAMARQSHAARKVKSTSPTHTSHGGKGTREDEDQTKRLPLLSSSVLTLMHLPSPLHKCCSPPWLPEVEMAPKVYTKRSSGPGDMLRLVLGNTELRTQREFGKKLEEAEEYTLLQHPEKVSGSIEQAETRIQWITSSLGSKCSTFVIARSQ